MLLHKYSGPIVAESDQTRLHCKRTCRKLPKRPPNSAKSCIIPFRAGLSRLVPLHALVVVRWAPTESWP
eukprot:6965755-Alexandrium_andersonii.AAC.1